MLNLLVLWVVVAGAILVAAHILPGMKIRDFKIALVAALVMGIVNALIQPIVAFFAYPITFITFGLFAWVINGLMLMLVAKLVPDFEVNGCLTAILGSIIVSLISTGAMALLPFAN
ncbi:MAG: phage holin family protein [Bryobacterales bacterium]|nr:phage holin family protein [Bryobacterales bacterium]